MAFTVSEGTYKGDTEVEGKGDFVSPARPHDTSGKSLIAEPDGVVGQAVDWVNRSTWSASQALGWFWDLLVSGGPGGYGGAGPDHAPISKGVVDVPDLNIPKEVVTRLYRLLSELPKLAVITIEQGLGALTEGVTSVFGLKNIGTQSGVEPGAPLPPEYQTKMKNLVDNTYFRKTAAVRGQDAVLVDGIFYRAYDPQIERILNVLGIALAILGPIDEIALGGAAVKGATQKLRSLGPANIRAIYDDFLRAIKGKKSGSGIDSSDFKVTKSTEKSTVLGPDGKPWTKRETEVWERVAKSGKVENPSAATRAGSALNKLSKASATKILREVLRLGAQGGKSAGGMVAWYFGLKITISQFIKNVQPGETANLTDEEIDDLASWYAFSIIFSKKGGDLVAAVRNSWKRFNHSTKIRLGQINPKSQAPTAGFLSSAVISEFIQYIAFVSSGGGSGDVADFVRWMAGVGAEEKLEQEVQNRNKGGLIAI